MKNEPTNKYDRKIADGVYIDVYDVLIAFNVTCPATAHAIKKLLAPGLRGDKNQFQDLTEAGDSIKRAIELTPSFTPCVIDTGKDGDDDLPF